MSAIVTLVGLARRKRNKSRKYHYLTNGLVRPVALGVAVGEAACSCPAAYSPGKPGQPPMLWQSVARSCTRLCAAAAHEPSAVIGVTGVLGGAAPARGGCRCRSREPWS